MALQSMSKGLRAFVLGAVLVAGPAALADNSEKNDLKITPINSPVKESQARFRIDLPQTFGGVDRLQGAEVTYSIGVGSGKPKDFDEKLFKNQKGELKISGAQVELAFVASALPPGKFALELKVKPAKSFLVRLLSPKSVGDVPGELKGESKFEVDASLEVPDPGAKGKLTLEGVDSDGDGVRDDIQRWINEAFSHSMREKAGMKQIARAAQEDLLVAQDQRTSIAAGHKLLDSLQCLYYVITLNRAIKVKDQLFAKLLNTDQRIRADIKANANFHGQIRKVETRDKKKVKCEFDPDTMRN